MLNESENYFGSSVGTATHQAVERFIEERLRIINKSFPNSPDYTI
jgi:hypothetical protein